MSPFTATLAIPLLFSGGIVLTVRGRVWAGFWLVFAVVVAAVVVTVHFLPGPRTETVGVIYRTYERGGVGAVAGVLAVADVAVILAGLGVLVGLAIRARRVSGRWQSPGGGSISRRHGRAG